MVGQSHTVRIHPSTGTQLSCHYLPWGCSTCAGRVETFSLQQNIEYFIQPSFVNIFQCFQGCALFPPPPTSAPHVQLPGLKVKLLSKITNLFFFEDLLQRWSRVGPRLPPLPPLKLCSTDYCASL